MKSLKGERKAYGIMSPLHHILDDAGLDYKGSRIGRDTKKPWIMYESERGKPVDLEALDKVLREQGFEHYTDLGADETTYPVEGVPGRGQRYRQYQYEKCGGRDGYRIEVLYLTTRFYDAGKGKKDYTSFEHIFY